MCTTLSVHPCSEPTAYAQLIAFWRHMFMCDDADGCSCSPSSLLHVFRGSCIMPPRPICCIVCKLSCMWLSSMLLGVVTLSCCPEVPAAALGGFATALRGPVAKALAWRRDVANALAVADPVACSSSSHAFCQGQCMLHRHSDFAQPCSLYEV